MLRFLITILLVAAAIYFAVAVPLGQKTLWQHLRAIASSKESQELVDEVTKKTSGALTPDGGGTRDRKNAPSKDKLTNQERKLLRRLIREKLSEGEEAGSLEKN